MSDDSYERLADALDRLPNGFPRTASGVEIRMLKKVFSPEEAWLASQLRGTFEPVDEVAQRLGLPEDEVLAQLKALARRGFIWGDKQDSKRRFRLAPWVVGIYEATLEDMDHELAHLFEEYWQSGGGAGIMKPQPALHRVVPARDTVKTEWILPYDDVRAFLLDAKTFRVRDCICRVQQSLVGRGCDAPVHNCLSFYPMVLPPSESDIALEEALALLDEAEEYGLVHTVSNVAKGVSYVCNCCGCCCGILRGINELGIENSVARANYYATIDADECTGCGICVDRCQVHAISDEDGFAVVDQTRCIGCGLCASGCPDEVPELHRRADAETVYPPADYYAWEQARLEDRGLL